MTTVLLILILLALLWIAGILLKLNANFVKWADADIRKRSLTNTRRI